MTSSLITRRALIRSGTGAAILGTAGLTYPASARAEPRKGGTLRAGVGAGSASDRLDPALAGDPFTIPMVFAYCNHLTEISPAGELIPELAESWEATEGAEIWRFKLRDGVEFHNGKTFDAEDVIATFNYHRGDDSKSKIKNLVSTIRDIRAPDPRTVVFELDSGNADFPFIVSDYHLGILPGTDGRVDADAGIGTGPYKVVSFEPGQVAEFQRNPNYWKDGRAHFDAFTLLAINDPTARTNALVTGEIDVMDRVELKTAALLGRREGVVVEEVTGTQHYTLPMRCDTAPFDDVNVRLALKNAIDREELVAKILHGHGSVGNDHPISTANRFFASDLEQRAYDPDRAKFHLKEAGLDRLEVPLHVSDAAFAGAVDTAVLYAEHAAKAGIAITVVREPADGYWDNVWMTKPWTASYWGGRPTEDWMFATAYESSAEWNEAFWRNERFDKLLAEARVELDEAKRRTMYADLQALVRDDCGSVIPMFANYVWARSDRVAHDDQVAANWDLDGSKFMERWWFGS